MSERCQASWQDGTQCEYRTGHIYVLEHAAHDESGEFWWSDAGIPIATSYRRFPEQGNPERATEGGAETSVP